MDLDANSSHLSLMRFTYLAEEELSELMELPWGDVRDTEGKGFKPEMSDDDFNTVLAQAMKLANANKDR